MSKEWRKKELTQDDFSLFYEVASSIHAVLDPDEMLQKILGTIKKVFHIEGASIAIHDAANSEFYFLRTVEDDINEKHRNNADPLRFPDHLGVAGWVLRENHAAIIPDVSKDDRFYRGMDEKEDFVTKSMICLPLRTRKGLLGLLYVLNKIDGKFTEKEGNLLETLSGWIAISLENAQMYGQLRQYATSLERENRALKSELTDHFNLQGIIGTSPAMRQVFHLLEKVIDTGVSVLIQGETGTGKELIAKAIHYNGPLKDKSFIAENCGALPENLLESEFFGHAKGAFTGAVTSKKGLFELADGGTIFLDEIGEMMMSMQVKLLRVIQEGQLRPVGGTSYRDINVRLIASTNRDLEKEVEKGNFRQDLLFRINVFPITLPPLRERREDIPLLAMHFLEKFAKKMKRPDAQILPDVMDLLTRFDWPGNIRELENELERALTLAGKNGTIKTKHLSKKLWSSAGNGFSLEETKGTLKEITEKIEIREKSKANGNDLHAISLGRLDFV
ncbi:MAG TPA: GAF domain-containing protein, partial [Desulfobacterales bacterium]|nr:GAF domain-containing protein [Desulfobacterales bacterium]